jgi:predicted alpha-1,2-mannosidase
MVSAAAPFGLIQIGPDTGMPDGSQDPVNYDGYSYQDSTIRGFSLTHFDGAGIMIAGDLPFMPVTGAVDPDPAKNASPYEHATEVAQPGYYAVSLQKPGARVELTSATRAAMMRTTFPGGGGKLVVDPTRSIDGSNQGAVEVAGPRTIQGWTRSPVGYRFWFTAVFDKPFTAEPKAGGATPLSFSDSVVTMRVAISYVDQDGAAANLASEIPAGASFEAVREQARRAWDAKLHKIETTGGSAEVRRTFYTSLYRSLLMPSIFEDADGRYMGFDGQVHQVEPGKDHHYTALSLWDTYRTQAPFLALIEPRVAHDVAISLLDDADQDLDQPGRLPRWVQANIERGIMGGDSAVATISDAITEGTLSDEEAARAYAAMLRQSTTLPPNSSRDGLEDYMARGWVGQKPSGRSGAALTLEYAIDDNALLGVARRHGTPEEIAALRGRAGNWANLMNPDGWLQPRDSDGNFVNPHPSGQLGLPWRPEFQDGWQEGTGWQYLWFAPQDVSGLADAMGGRDVAIDRLDQFFRAPSPVQEKTSFFGVYYIGNQYTPGNETDLWAPWYYDWLGQPWKTQREVRQAMSVFSSRPDGMPGNDDTGTMGSWYVLAALGIYHAAPGVEAWQLNSPSFDRATIHTGKKKSLTITAPGASRLNKFVQSARLNKKPFERTWLASSELRKGRLDYVLGARPNKSWASGPSAAPPALSGN